MGKIVRLDELITLRASLLSAKTIVLATGVYDILHIEHLRFLKKAKAEGDILIVGIESDERVRKLKGKGRPINPQNQRAEIAAALELVDYAFILPNNLGTKKGREALIKAIRPERYAISANTPFQEEKKRVMEKFGGKLKVVLPHNPEVSTSKIIKAQSRSRRRGKLSNI
ncbi:adenylyltransferase/cytidyltransferase family protein [Patescibacteria group bacterium]|nr:adenylyltransferase/cytidyltransferase family protein [Patescibacteria group bacterium]